MNSKLFSRKDRESLLLLATMVFLMCVFLVRLLVVMAHPKVISTYLLIWIKVAPCLTWAERSSNFRNFWVRKVDIVTERGLHWYLREKIMKEAQSL